jgi:hypothetical protein
LLVPVGAWGQNFADDPEARKIFEEVDRRRDQITYEQADLEMIIYDSRDRTRNRHIRSYSFNDGDASNSLLIFEEPANVRGTGFLTISEGSDEVQKLYLPALRRIQVISAAEKSDRFMGSDFTYEDLGDQDPDDYIFAMHAQTDTAYVLKARKKVQSQYAYIYFYVDPDRYVLQRAEYFNDNGEMIKRLEADGHVQVLDQVWRPESMTMFDLRENRKTTLSWSNRIINEPIADWRFSERGLLRGR